MNILTLLNLNKNSSICIGNQKKKSWQIIREFPAKYYVVRFFPWKKVDELIEFSAFDLQKDDVTYVTGWDELLESYHELHEVLVVKWIPPKWCALKVLLMCLLLWDPRYCGWE